MDFFIFWGFIPSVFIFTHGILPVAIIILHLFELYAEFSHRVKVFLIAGLYFLGRM